MSCSELRPVLEEQARILAEIRQDLREAEARQLKLVESLTSLTKDVMTTSRPAATIQIGGFVLAVIMLLMNSLGLRISASKNGLQIESEQGQESASKAPHP